MKRILYLHGLHDELNREVFGGKLMPITILIKRNRYVDGFYTYATERRAGEADLWFPRRDALGRASLSISSGCWREGSVIGTMLHEMVHQYQAEVMDRPAHHDATFKSICRHLERRYKVQVR